MDEEVALLLLPDHPTPCNLRTHVLAPVPFMLMKSTIAPDEVQVLDEESVKKGSFGEIEGKDILELLFSK